jgi:hypothetical protein
MITGIRVCMSLAMAFVCAYLGPGFLMGLASTLDASSAPWAAYPLGFTVDVVMVLAIPHSFIAAIAFAVPVRWLKRICIAGVSLCVVGLLFSYSPRSWQSRELSDKENVDRRAAMVAVKVGRVPSRWGYDTEKREYVWYEKGWSFERYDWFRWSIFASPTLVCAIEIAIRSRLRRPVSGPGDVVGPACE